MTTMDLLSNEVLDIMFQYLSTPEQVCVCARVCRRWQLVVERRALALREEADVLRLHAGTRAMLLTMFPVDLVATLDVITTKVRFLRELTAHAPASFDEHHEAALRLLPNLKHLDIFTNPRVLNERLVTVIKPLKTLVANENLAPGLLRGLSTGSQLVALHMFGRAVHYPQREMLAVLRDRGPHLRELTLRCNELTDAAYGVIGDCLNLRSLQLYSCWLLTAVGARAVCRPRHVRRLHVTGARLVRSQALADMLELLPERLYELVLSSGWFGDEHVNILAGRVSDLRILELWCCKMTKIGAQRLVYMMPKLEQLDLDLVMPKRCLQIMAHHPCLRVVRCIAHNVEKDPARYMEDHTTWEVDGLQIISTYEPYAPKYFRPGGEGYRSSLFYYWTQDVPLEPLPSWEDPYEDLFY